MTKQGHIRVDDERADRGERRATIEVSADDSRELWFTSDHGALSTDTADAFLLGSLLVWMSTGVDVHVHGTLTRRLLAGLEEWQAAWVLWRPDRYRKITITADTVIDATPRACC
ncbi:MAG TPA: hypothetical protein VGE77_07080 [Nocardioides sp.]